MELRQFLVRAKTSTYASKGEGDERILADGNKELTFLPRIYWCAAAQKREKRRKHS